jgi:rhodanese-related sulfurtransferase
LNQLRRRRAPNWNASPHLYETINGAIQNEPEEKIASTSITSQNVAPETIAANPKTDFQPDPAVGWLGIVAVVLPGLSSSTPETPPPLRHCRARSRSRKPLHCATKRAFILDVREPDEWVESHIPGATLIPLGELASRVDEVPQDQEVVVVCRSGNRSAEGRDILLAAGFEQVTSMAGGVNQWKAAGFETVSGP